MIGVSTSEELKDVLENENEYKFIYLMADITLSSGIKINEKKEKIIIDGTYNNIRYTLTGVTSTEAADMIMASSLNKEIVVRNININFLNTYRYLCAIRY